MIPPPIFRPGPHSMRAEPGKVTLRSGVVLTKDKYGYPIRPDLALAYAIDHAIPGDVIGCSGTQTAHIGRGDPNKATSALWANGAVIRDVTLVSLDPANRGRVSVSFDGDVTKPGQGGVDNFTLSGVDLMARFFANGPGTQDDNSEKTALLVYRGSTHGLIRVQDFTAYAENPSSFGGYGMMWGCRGHGWAQWDVRKGKCKKAQEHFWYFDAPQGDSYFIDLEQIEPSGRTCLQVDERKSAWGYGGTGYTGITRPSLGGLLYRNVRAWTDSGGGGSAFTIAGHSGGPVILENVSVKGDLGAVAVWADWPKGCYLTPDGKIVPQFVLNGFRSDAQLDDRSLVAIKGCSQVDIYLDTKPDGSPESEIRTNRIGIDLDNSYGGPINNGKVNLYAAGRASQYAGWKAGVKLKRFGTTYSDLQIDALNVATPGVP